jgi:hypothetical protein
MQVLLLLLLVFIILSLFTVKDYPCEGECEALLYTHFQVVGVHNVNCDCLKNILRPPPFSPRRSYSIQQDMIK